MKDTQAYIPLDALATRLGLPRTYLRNLAKEKLIPCLNVNGRLRFDEGSVREALRCMASTVEGDSE